jgi:hypothetical protein
VRRAKKAARLQKRRSLMRDLLEEIRALRFELEQARGATERDTIWTAQAARGKDSAGNWR